MIDETIKISFIVPIYNVEDYLKPCIESIIGQTYKNLEIILVDDGSTDRCPEICDAYAEKDKRVCVIHKRNGGVVSARKAGAAVATGDYVLGLDGDDWIDKDRIEVLVKEGIIPDYADMIHLSGYILDFGKESIHRSFDIPIKLFEKDEIENEIFPLMMLSQKISPSLGKWAIRRELFLKNLMLIDDSVSFGEDWLCICFCLLEAKSVRTIQQGGYHYVQRASSITHQISTPSDKSLLPVKIWYEVLKNQMEQRHVSEKVRKICSHIVLFHIFWYYRNDYGLILQKFPDYLFPFPNVNNGSRIVVYGAGEVGYSLVESLSKTKRCSVVLWVDQNQSRPTVQGYTISSRDAIYSADYDFIVVTIMNAVVAEEVKCSLIQDGIPGEKVVTMNIDAF